MAGLGNLQMRPFVTGEAGVLAGVALGLAHPATLRLHRVAGAV
jgi:hypothetical protein